MLLQKERRSSWNAVLEQRNDLAGWYDAYAQTIHTINQAAERMRLGRFFNWKGFERRLTGYDYGLLTDVNFFVTDKPECLPIPSPIYHCTGELAAEAIINQEDLLPRNLHSGYLVTDKGIALHLTVGLFHALGIKTGALADMVFLGRYIDAEQIYLHNHGPVAKGDKYDNLVTDLFFKVQPDGSLTLNDSLDLLLDALEKRQIPDNIPVLKTMADSWIQDFYELTNIREGFLREIRDTLYGRRKIPDPLLKSQFLSLLTVFYDSYKNIKKQSPKHAVVLEVDAVDLVKKSTVGGLFPVLVGDTKSRSLNSILPVPTLFHESVRTIYASAEFIARHPNSHISLKPFSNIPGNAWLGGITPDQIRATDMFKPICQMRYSSDMTWINSAKQGLLVPAFSIHQQSLEFRGTAMLIELFGPQIVEPNFIAEQEQSMQSFSIIAATDFPVLNGVFR